MCSYILQKFLSKIFILNVSFAFSERDFKTNSLPFENLANNVPVTSKYPFLLDSNHLLLRFSVFIEIKDSSVHQETRSIKCRELQARFHKVPIFSTLIGLLGIKDLIF